jgi:hypothetical protein
VNKLTPALAATLTGELNPSHHKIRLDYGRAQLGRKDRARGRQPAHAPTANSPGEPSGSSGMSAAVELLERVLTDFDRARKRLMEAGG